MTCLVLLVYTYHSTYTVSTYRPYLLSYLFVFSFIRAYSRISISTHIPTLLHKYAITRI